MSVALEKFKNRQQLIDVAKKKANYVLTKKYPSLSNPTRSRIVYMTRQFLYPYQTADGKMILRIQRKPLALDRIKSYLSEHTDLSKKEIKDIANKMMSPTDYINIKLPEKQRKTLTPAEKEKTTNEFHVRTSKKVRKETEKRREALAEKQPQPTIATAPNKQGEGFFSKYWPLLAIGGGATALYTASKR